MRPSRLAVISSLMYKFFREFFNQNPLSQLGLVVTRNGIAERVTELSGNPETHIAALKENLDAAGDMSIQNSLEQVHASLVQLPMYGSREVLFVVSALSTCDPGNVHTAIAAAKKRKDTRECRLRRCGDACVPSNDGRDGWDFRRRAVPTPPRGAFDGARAASTFERRIHKGVCLLHGDDIFPSLEHVQLH